MIRVPVTMATGEKSLSKLKMITKYLRTTMAQERLGEIILLSIEDEAEDGL